MKQNFDLLHSGIPRKDDLGGGRKKAGQKKKKHSKFEYVVENSGPKLLLQRRRISAVRLQWSRGLSHRSDVTLSLSVYDSCAWLADVWRCPLPIGRLYLLVIRRLLNAWCTLFRWFLNFSPLGFPPRVFLHRSEACAPRQVGGSGGKSAHASSAPSSRPSSRPPGRSFRGCW